MIDPRAQEAHRQHQRRADAAQRLVEIGAFLFGNVVQTLRRNAPACCIRQRVEIADHRPGQLSLRQCRIRATICCDQERSMCHGQFEIPGRDLATPDQGDPLRCVDNMFVHAVLMQVLETGHNLATK